MIMRLASAAESAAQPAHFLPPPLIGNAGEQGQFVLPVGNPAAGGKQEAYDDFNYPAAPEMERARRPSAMTAIQRDGRARRLAGAHAVCVQQRECGRLGTLPKLR